MQIQPKHPNFQLPIRATKDSGGYDLFMPEAGELLPGHQAKKYSLGFAAAIPKGFVAFLIPRSGTGAKFSVDLNNTVGVIDADYRGEWFAFLRLKSTANAPFRWQAGDRLIQMVLVPVHTPVLELVETLDATERGEGGFNSTGR